MKDDSFGPNAPPLRRSAAPGHPPTRGVDRADPLNTHATSDVRAATMRVRSVAFSFVRLFAASLVVACGPAVVDVPTVYPGLDEAVSCSTSPSLCGLALHDLGGGNHDNAWHIVFVGDGYLDDEQLDFAWGANALAAEMLHPDGVFANNNLVEQGPDVFHFWRVDVPSSSIEVDDDVLTNTPLGAHLGPPDNCVGRPLIRALEDRFALALDKAVLASAEDEANDRLWQWGPDDAGVGDLREDEIDRWPHTAQVPLTSWRATFVLLSNRSSGRANATPGGNVRLSSHDSADVLAHELGHALFGLGDEYTEFSTCDVPASNALACGPPADVSEVTLLETPNTSTFHDGSKWFDDVDGSTPGGNRWPCHAHPTGSCLMLDGTGPLCPVCSSAVAERIAMRRCLPDTRAPRVAIEQAPTVFGGGTKALVAASAFDERRASPWRGPLAIAWVLDDGEGIDGVAAARPFAEGPFAVVDLAMARGHAVRAVASDGTFTARSSVVALPDPTLGDEDDVVADSGPLTLRSLGVAGVPATVEDAATGTTVQLVKGIGPRVTVTFGPASCTRVAQAGVDVAADDGLSTTVPVADLGDDNRVNCGPGTPPSLAVSFERPATGAQFKVQGFVVDARGRQASTVVWTPRAVDDDACPLAVVAHDDSGHALHGAFDGLVLTTKAQDPVQFDVRAGHASVRTSPLGDPTSGVSLLAVAFAAPTGDGIDVSVLAVCTLSSTTDGVTTRSWVTSSARIPLAWDNEPPAIAASTSVPPETEAWDIAVVDDSAITAVTVAPRDATDGAIELRAPPWRVSPPPRGPVTIRAVDAAGNVATRDVDVVVQRTLDAQVICR